MTWNKLPYGWKRNLVFLERFLKFDQFEDYFRELEYQIEKIISEIKRIDWLNIGKSVGNSI